MRQNSHTQQIDEAPIAEALGSSIGSARNFIADLEKAGFLIMRLPRGDLAAISEAVRTGNWSNVTEWDWKAWLAAVHAGFITKDAASTGVEPEPKAKAGRVVVLDEASERKLQDLLAGRSVPTGRLVEVTYRMPDGSTQTQRHAEFGKLDEVSFDTRPPTGAEVEGADVLCARVTVKLQPGKPASSAAFDRDVEVLGVFWADGVISFSGEASQMVAFREMAAGVAGVSGSRMAFL